MIGSEATAKLRHMRVLTLLCRKELKSLVRRYNHVESEHERAHPSGGDPPWEHPWTLPSDGLIDV